LAGHTFDITLIPGGRLTSRQIAIWRELQYSNPELANPCFAPEFTQAIAAARRDVEIGLIRQNHELVAIFPFQRKHGARAVPVGGVVSDYQGLICCQGFTCEPLKILEACHVVAWDFDRLLASQRLFAPFHKFCEPSARINLSRGYAHYVAQRRAAGTQQINQCDYNMRRMERELGPLRFVTHSPNPALLAQVLCWKSQQYRRSGWRDLFATAWGRAIVERIFATQNAGFAGMLSLLYAGPHLVAGHMGMRSCNVWHYWFPAYDRRFAKYSPGLILLLKMAQYAEHLGLQTIDLGTGITLYKNRLMNDTVLVGEGSLERPSCLSLLRHARRKLKSFILSLAGGSFY